MGTPAYRDRSKPLTHPWRDCPSRKIVYRSREEALVAAILRPDHEGDNATTPYECPRCGLWHLTTVQSP